MIHNVNQFNQHFQLYQKDDRYNLHLHHFSKNEFIQRFFQDKIEDLHLNYFDQSIQKNKIINDYQTKFNDYFNSTEELNQVEIDFISGYLQQFDFYFTTENEALVLNYIHRNFLSQLLDILLAELDCNFISRLKTELLINLEYD